MSEIKDPKIKLFGKTIELPETSTAAEGGGAQSCETVGEDSLNQDPPSHSMVDDAGEQQSVKSLPGPKQDNPIEEAQTQPLTSKETKDSNTTAQVNEDSKSPSAVDESPSAKTSKTEDDQNDSQDKTLKKPDKILPCPRCNSMDTKFCYFNNYNVNQPRHFCKNCQRYWTAGGTMRNVPVGAGRRKNKHSISQFRHLNVPEASPNGIHHHALNPNATVLTFTSDSPLCESMASGLNIADKTVRNGPHKPEQLEISVKENIDDEACKNGSREMIPNCNPFPPQVPFFPGAPWPYPFPPPTFNPAVQFYSTPPPYWGCAVPASWNVPWIVPPPLAASQIITPPGSGPNSPTLGKHSRDDNIMKVDSTKEEGLEENGSEKCLWVPKTLRIDDPGEAAKSSIWATLGIKHDDKGDSIGGGGLFKAFQREKTKGDEKIHVPESSTVLQANPAALSRSVSFHESS